MCIFIVWMSSSDSLELSSVPFLPVDPSYSATRNQGRQKLARFTVQELKQLVSDLLNEIRRRQLTIIAGTIYQRFINTDIRLKSLSVSDASGSKHISQISDDEPLYDSVASDEDYAIVTPSVSVSTKCVHFLT